MTDKYTSSIMKKSEVSTSKRQSLSVTFNKFVICKNIKPLIDYTDEEMNSIWYADYEYHEFKRNIKETIRMMMEGYNLPEDETNFCYQGLEMRTKVGSALRRKRKEAVKSAVLFECASQEIGFKVDEIEIANVSLSASLSSRQEATERGLEYQRQVTLIRVQDMREQKARKKQLQHTSALLSLYSSTETTQVMRSPTKMHNFKGTNGQPGRAVRQIRLALELY